MSGAEINWTLLKDLAGKPHKHLKIAGDFEAQIHDTPISWIGEVFQEARTVQHLCDIAGLPEGEGYSAHIDARVFLLLAERNSLSERLDRIGAWHSRETGPAGTVGDYCNECGSTWPCETKRMAEGTYVDPDGAS